MSRSHFPIPIRTVKSSGRPETMIVKLRSAVMMSRRIPAFCAWITVPRGAVVLWVL